MKKILLAASLLCSTLYAQTDGSGIDAILRHIENHNPQLQANVQRATAQRWANRAENNLEDPRLSYSHVWDSRDASITAGELIVSQGFDFPTLYASRSRLNRQRSQTLDTQAAALRQEVLLEAQELCIDIICLHQQLQIALERQHHAEELARIYQQRLETGESNVLEANKLNLEQLNARTETRRLQTQLEASLRQLWALGGNQQMGAGRPMADPMPPTAEALRLTDYPDMPLPDDFRPLCQELLQADPALLALKSQQEASRREQSVARQGWLPKLEVGYRRNTDSGHPLNGVVVGCSFPLFQNRGKATQAKATLMADRIENESARLATESALWQLYEEARTWQVAIREYQTTLEQQQDLRLLEQALTGGQINLTEYLLEANRLYESRDNLVRLQGDYHKSMARLLKSRL